MPLKEMKADWHACLDNKVGFKVSSAAIFKYFSHVLILYEAKDDFIVYNYLELALDCLF